MPIQFRETIPFYMVGRRINMEEWNTITRIAQEEPIAFGVPVVQGANPRGVINLSAAGQNVIGITEASFVLPHPGDEYELQDTAGICEVGVIGGMVEVQVGTKDIARFNTATGMWTNAAASATVLEIPGAEFDEAAEADTAAAIRYRRPVPSLSVGV